MTRPRRLTNQRWVTVAPKAVAVEPVPRPTSTPQYRVNCQAVVMTEVSAAPEAMSTSATTTTRRMPKRSMRAAANGAVRPYRTMFTEVARPIDPRDQPNSCRRGPASRPGRVEKAPATTIASSATAATHHAR